MPTALLSVYEKSGLIELAQGLVAHGWKLLASGSTAQHLRAQQIPVTEVADHTGSPEMLGGRVKTLHPAIHGGILARATETDRKELQTMNLDYIDLVAVNLYPFEQTIAKPHVTFEEAIEQIDIGGVALIRAAAKNHQRVTLLCEPADYAKILAEIKNGGIQNDTRKKFAIKGFALTSQYDAAITQYLAPESPRQLNLYPVQTLRYGENPHQKAKLYAYSPKDGPLGGQLLQGKELSFNNLLDLDAAWKTVVNFATPTICIVKHVSPCGIATNENLVTAFEAALACDPVSAFGGIIATNRPFDAALADGLGKLFVECIAAPQFTQEAREILAHRNNCRLLQIPSLSLEPHYELRSINRGILQQDLDLGDPQDANWQVVTKRQPTEQEWQDLRFAWQACQSIKSNAIVFAKNNATLGIGSGQPNRIDCVKIAGERAGDKSKAAVMASDAFFPFADGVELAARFHIAAIIQPGGSVRDAESIAAADAANMAMIFTGVRHFRH